VGNFLNTSRTTENDLLAGALIVKSDPFFEETSILQ
jgi:hypothetical protein